MVYFKHFWIEQRSRVANINFSEPLSLRPWCWCRDVPILGELGIPGLKFTPWVWIITDTWIGAQCQDNKSGRWPVKNAKLTELFSPLIFKKYKSILYFHLLVLKPLKSFLSHLWEPQLNKISDFWAKIGIPSTVLLSKPPNISRFEI